MAKFKLVLIDRPAWFLPSIEQEEFSKIDGEVLVGWARLGESRELDPAIAKRGVSAETLSRGSVAYVAGGKHTADVYERMAYDADAIMVTPASVTAEAMDRMPRLRVIGKPGIGYDVVDVAAATARGIVVFSAPGFCAKEVADHTMMMMLGLARKAPLLGNAMRKGIYERSLPSPMTALYEMTLGLVAFGDIAREVALRAKPFGLKVIAFDPFVDKKTADAHGVTLVDLDTLLAQADVVSVHAPLMKETRHMIGEREFGLMKPTAVILNTARGPVIDQTALISALQAKRIAGAGLDVYDHEPLEADSPLLHMDNVILTPHMAGLSDTSQMAVRRRTVRNVANALVGKWPETRDLVNPKVKENLRRVPPSP